MDQKRYKDFMDMFDGGGPGQMGDTFQGGGLFSLIANMVADPYGSKDPERRKERMKALGLLDTNMDMSKPPAAPVAEPVVPPKPLTYGPQNGRGGNRGVSPEERLMQMPVAPMSAEDRLMQQSLMANPLYAQAAAELGMGLDPFGYPQSPTISQAPLQSGKNQINSSMVNAPQSSMVDNAVPRGVSGAVPNNYAEGVFGVGGNNTAPTVQQNDRLVRFNYLTSTIPAQLMGTQAAQVYADAVMNGRTNLPFKDFFGQNFR